MKKFSKILSVALLVALVLSLGVANAFAAGEGTLTVKNSETGTTYNFYKIFDLTGTDTSDPADNKYDAVAYTIASKWSGFFVGDNAPGAAYLVASQPTGGNLNPINVNGTTMYINITEGNRVDFTNAAMKYAVDNGIVAETSVNGDTGKDVSVTGLDLGYYLMVPVNVTDEKTNPLTTGSVASLTSTIPSGDIYVKATKPSVEKTDNVVSADIGQTVTYTLKGTVPNTSGTATFVYKLSDKMTSGLTFNKDVAVKIGSTDIAKETADAWITYSNDGFVIDIPVTQYQNQKGEDIVLTYTAVVNENAIVSTNEKNEAKVLYGRNPDKLEESTPVHEELYSANIIINKYTGDSATTGPKLAGAQFALMKISKDDGAALYYKYTAPVAAAGGVEAQAAKVEWVAVNGAPANGTDNVTDAQAKALADATNISTVTTDANGAARFEGLADGDYFLVEFAAPTGYNRLATPQAVKVQGKNVDTTEHLENTAYADNTFDEAVDVTADVVNNSGTVLPSTGGIGTTIFYVVGGVLVLAAIILLVTKKRMSE